MNFSQQIFEELLYLFLTFEKYSYIPDETQNLTF